MGVIGLVLHDNRPYLNGQLSNRVNCSVAYPEPTEGLEIRRGEGMVITDLVDMINPLHTESFDPV